MHKSSAYITDEFGSLSGFPDVGTVGHSGVVQAGFSVLLVRNLWMDKKGDDPNCPGITARRPTAATLTLLWLLATSMACLTSGGTIIWL